jgi:hypothetical protein
VAAPVAAGSASRAVNSYATPRRKCAVSNMKDELLLGFAWTDGEQQHRLLELLKARLNEPVQPKSIHASDARAPRAHDDVAPNFHVRRCDCVLAVDQDATLPAELLRSRRRGAQLREQRSQHDVRTPCRPRRCYARMINQMSKVLGYVAQVELEDSAFVASCQAIQNAPSTGLAHPQRRLVEKDKRWCPHQYATRPRHIRPLLQDNLLPTKVPRSPWPLPLPHFAALTTMQRRHAPAATSMTHAHTHTAYQNH